MSNELAKTKKTSVKQLLNQDNVKKKFQEMLGKKAQGFLVSVINTVTSNTNLAEAEPNSVLFAAATAASLDLPINENLGFAYIIPYNRKMPDGSYQQVAQFQLGYKGYIQLAMRSGQFKTISATPIYEGQIVDHNPLTGIQFDFTQRDSDTVIGYAAYFSLINGFEKVFYMTVDELKKHGSKYSKTFGNKYGRWNQDFDSMATKTVLKLLLSKYAPLSIDMQKAIVTDQSVVNDWEGEDVDYVDNDEETLDLEQLELRKESERISKFIDKAETLDDLNGVDAFIQDGQTDLFEKLENKKNELRNDKTTTKSKAKK